MRIKFLLPAIYVLFYFSYLFFVPSLLAGDYGTADINKDGIVNLTDFSLLANNWFDDERLYPYSVADSEYDFYISPDGNDSWSGKLCAPNRDRTDGPFATLSRVKDAVRQLKQQSGLSHDIKVALRDGIYYLAQTLVFTPEDSGTDDNSIIYEAFMDELPIVSGGRRIENWSLVANLANGKLWRTTLPYIDGSLWSFRELFCDHQRLTRARHPNATSVFPSEQSAYFTVKTSGNGSKSIVLNESTGKNVSGGGLEAVALFQWCESRSNCWFLKGSSVECVDSLGWFGWAYMSPQPGTLIYLENAYDFLDVPGEWYLDIAMRRLYYVSGSQENPNNHYFTAPVLDKLLIVEGQRGDPVKNIQFKGISFGYAGWKMKGNSFVNVQSCLSLNTSDMQSYFEPDVNIELNYAQDVLFEGCRFAHMGASAVAMGAGTHRNKIIGCEFADIGGNGIIVGWRGKRNPSGRISEKGEDWIFADQLRNSNDDFFYNQSPSWVNWENLYYSQSAGTYLSMSHLADDIWTAPDDSGCRITKSTMGTGLQTDPVRKWKSRSEDNSLAQISAAIGPVSGNSDGIAFEILKDNGPGTVPVLVYGPAMIYGGQSQVLESAVNINENESLYFKMNKYGSVLGDLTPVDITIDLQCPNNEDVPSFNRIEHNYFQRCGVVHYCSNAVFHLFAKNTQISNNLVQNLPWGGMTIGFHWLDLPNSTESIKVQYNHILDFGKILHDLGGIYTLGRQERTLIEYNLIHQVHDGLNPLFSGYNCAIFCDNGSSMLTLLGNIAYDYWPGESYRRNSGDLRTGGTSYDYINYGKNYFGIQPTNPSYNNEIDKQTGIKGKYRSILNRTIFIP